MNLFLKTGEPLPDLGCASSIVQLGDFFFFSGQNGKGDTFDDQCLSCLYSIQEALHEFDLRLDHVINLNVYLTDLSLKSDFVRIFNNFVEAPYPAMTIVEVSALEHDAMICISGNGVNTLRYEHKMDEAYCDDCD